MAYYKNPKIFLSASILYFLTCFDCAGQDQSQFDSANLDSLFQQNVDSGNIHGAVVLVNFENENQYIRSYGRLSIEDNIPMRNDALFRIASMTKIITSIGLMILYEDGKLDLRDPVSQYLPQFSDMKVITNVRLSGDIYEFDTKSANKEIRILDLLRHTSGIDYGFYGGPLDKVYNSAGFANWSGSLEEFVNQMAKLPLLFEPGTQWQYGYSLDIAGYLIEVVSGKPLNQFLKERIFIPMGMSDTDFFVPGEKLERLSNHYRFKNGNLNLEEEASTSKFKTLPAALSGGGGWYDGYGGIVTTAEDFAKVLQLILNKGTSGEAHILKPETIKYMYLDHISEIKNRGFPVSGYGIGAGVEKDKVDSNMPGDIFWAGGPYNTYFFLSFKERAFAILLMQNAPFGHLDLMDKFEKVVRSSLPR